MKRQTRMLGAVLLAGAMAAPLSASAVQLVSNGGFETGNFAGWTTTTLTTLGCQTDWNVSASGIATGCEPVGDPPVGTYAAYNSFDGAGPLTYSLRQVIALPTGLVGATLSWQDTAIWEGFTLDPMPRDFTVDVYDAAGTTLLGNLYTLSFDLNTPGSTPWTAHSINALSLLGALGGSSVTLAFQIYVPEDFTGPAGFGLDAVSLDVAVVPEPGTLALLGLGLAGLAATRRRKQ